MAKPKVKITKAQIEKRRNRRFVTKPARMAQRKKMKQLVSMLRSE